MDGVTGAGVQGAGTALCVAGWRAWPGSLIEIFRKPTDESTLSLQESGMVVVPTIPSYFTSTCTYYDVYDTHHSISTLSYCTLQSTCAASLSTLHRTISSDIALPLFPQ
jgi:hypothetical protein